MKTYLVILEVQKPRSAVWEDEPVYAFVQAGPDERYRAAKAARETFESLGCTCRHTIRCEEIVHETYSTIPAPSLN